MTELIRATKATKAWVALIGGIVTAMTAAFADNVFDTSDIVGLFTATFPLAVTVFTVYQVPNKPKL